MVSCVWMQRTLLYGWLCFPLQSVDQSPFEKSSRKRDIGTGIESLSLARLANSLGRGKGRVEGFSRLPTLPFSLSFRPSSLVSFSFFVSPTLGSPLCCLQTSCVFRVVRHLGGRSLEGCCIYTPRLDLPELFFRLLQALPLAVLMTGWGSRVFAFLGILCRKFFSFFHAREPVF